LSKELDKELKKEKEDNGSKKIEDLAKEYLDPEKRFEDLFPHLAKEMNFEGSLVKMKGIRWDVNQYTDSDDFNELKNPDVVAFIRRCSYKEEAIEIIEFMLRRGEINEGYAEKLKDQIEEYGLESFGSRKTPGYYEKKFPR